MGEYFALVDQGQDSACGLWLPSVEGKFSADDDKIRILANGTDAPLVHLGGFEAPPSTDITEVKRIAKKELAAATYIISLPCDRCDLDR
tara:strand:- start:279 stop:545 length:267 start_codon:yes stop_codon:yes gene_type:complete